MLFKNLVEIKGNPFIIDMMYSMENNMVGISAYKEIKLGNRAFVHKDLWKRLKKLVPILSEKKLKLKIRDAYRPPSAHTRMRNVIPRKGFFADSPETSQHCRATAVDVILTDLNDNELKFPTKVDGYDPYYAKEVQSGRFDEFFEHLKKADYDFYDDNFQEEITNRNMLCKMMKDIGLERLQYEWWHFNLPGGNSEKYPVIDFSDIDKI